MYVSLRRLVGYVPGEDSASVDIWGVVRMQKVRSVVVCVVWRKARGREVVFEVGVSVLESKCADAERFELRSSS